MADFFNIVSNTTLNGSEEADNINNMAENVVIYAGNGGDFVNNTPLSTDASGSPTSIPNQVVIYGEGGNDTINNASEYVTINGGIGDDSIISTNGTEFFQYNLGDGRDTIYGYTSADTLNISGASYSSIESGNNIIITVGEGTDSVGTITLIDAAGNTVNIAGDGGSNSGGTTDTTPGSGTTDTTSDGGTATNNAYDIVFLIDNTGSMYRYISNVKNNVTTFTNNLGNVDYRLGLVEFGDLYDSDIKTYEFTANSDEFLADLNAIELTGGADRAESGLEALTEGMAMDFRDSAEKRFIAVTDAPYHNQGESSDYGDSSSYLYVDDVVASLKEKGIVVDVVGTTYARYGIDSAQYEWDEPIASVTGGQFYDIEGDFPSLISDLAKNISGSGTPQMHLSRWSYEYTFPEATSDVPILTSST